MDIPGKRPMAEGHCFQGILVRRSSRPETLVTREEHGAFRPVVMYTGASRRRPAPSVNATPPSEVRLALLGKPRGCEESFIPGHLGSGATAEDQGLEGKRIQQDSAFRVSRQPPPSRLHYFPLP